MENGELRFSKAYPVDTAEGRKEKFIFLWKGKILARCWWVIEDLGRIKRGSSVVVILIFLEHLLLFSEGKKTNFPWIPITSSSVIGFFSVVCLTQAFEPKKESKSRPKTATPCWPPRKLSFPFFQRQERYLLPPSFSPLKKCAAANYWLSLSLFFAVEETTCYCFCCGNKLNFAGVFLLLTDPTQYKNRSAAQAVVWEKRQKNKTVFLFRKGVFISLPLFLSIP